VALVSGRGQCRFGGPVIEISPLAESDTAADGTSDRRVAGDETVGPHRIAYHLSLPQSTVSKVPGVRVWIPKPLRYERENPGDLIHVDVKKLGRTPDGGGLRTLGRSERRTSRSGTGYAFLHYAIDDHTRWSIPRS
jgi:hypothetical protein